MSEEINIDFSPNPIQDLTHFPDSERDKIKCPKCKQKISPNANYCDYCGEEIVLYCPRCEQFIERARGVTNHICDVRAKINRYSNLVKAAHKEAALNKQLKQTCPACGIIFPISEKNNCPKCKNHILTYDELMRDK
jgi:rRNA maturation endonuclease Nob1